jgi:putative transposase
MALAEQIRAIHTASFGTYGSPRVHAELRDPAGPFLARCSRKRVARLMRRHGLVGCHRRRRRRTTVRDPLALPAPDLVQRRFAPATIAAANRLWVADITYVWTLEGWLYLAVVLDCFSRRVVGWSMATHLRTALVADALAMAVRNRRPRRGLVHHSDKGSQYTSLVFGHQLRESGLVASTGSVGDALDNAVAESFFATLKCELAHMSHAGSHQPWLTRDAARSAFFAYIEAWYNRRRRHSTLGYLSPMAFEEVHAQQAIA